LAPTLCGTNEANLHQNIGTSKHYTMHFEQVNYFYYLNSYMSQLIQQKPINTAMLQLAQSTLHVT